MERRVSSIVVIVFCALLLGGVAKANDDPNWGYLTFEPHVGTSPINNLLTVVKDDEFLDPDPNDSIDDHDVLGYGLYMNGASWIYSDVNGTDLWGDFRANASRTPIRIKVGYKGTIVEGSEPNIVVKFSWDYPGEGEFGTIPLILTQKDADGNNLETGYRGDARAEIDYGGGLASIDFGKLPAGTYTPDTPFLHLRLDFG